MKRNIALFALTLTMAAFATAATAERIHHDMKIDLEAARHWIAVSDQITLGNDERNEFLLNSRLAITASEPSVEEIPLGDIDAFFGINGSSDQLSEQIQLKRYRLTGPAQDGVLKVTYEGEIHFELSAPEEEYSRGFRETAGILSDEGVYQAGSGFWYPYFDDGLLTFELEVTVPEGWHVISQGDGSSRGAGGKARWDSHGAMDEIYLVGGPLVVYQESAGAMEAQVYLHEPDDALAAKFLTTTAQYIELYRQLIGPYPYGKFALVENLWETGYGMPSFTLLGPKVLRFPFILHSSYPHEILHNWWGNSVFVDYETGNWCEGLTAYMADHMVQEQRGKGEQYRRTQLQAYRDHVKEGRDFPLTEFRSRHSAATAAVGYGKTLMVFHMLRRDFGDDAFRAAMVRLYRSQKGKRASFGDVRGVFEDVTESDLGWYFEQWVERTGAPRLTVEVEDTEMSADGYRIRGKILQTQTDDAYRLQLPVVIQTADGASKVTTIALAERDTSFELEGQGRPVQLAVDPGFDVFRQLDPRETPPSIGQLFGEPEILAVLPTKADKAEIDRYRELMTGWIHENHQIEIKSDSEIDELPADRAVWILGRSNRFVFDGESAEIPFGVEGEEVRMADEKVVFADHSLVVVRRHAENLEKVVGWLVVEPPAAFAGMGRKLPHYGKYSYLGFEGDEPTNVVKGQWNASDSPLRLDLRPASQRDSSLPALVLENRSALAELPPVFSEQALAGHVAFLASDELEGRGLGSQGIEQARDHIVKTFEAAGLEPGGDDGGWLQSFSVAGPDGAPIEATNIVGFLPGSKSEWKQEAIVLSAHYDHLGRGWPDVHQGDEGEIHPGADDNASGVAVLLEMAKVYGAGEKPMRNLVFIAFSAEEAGKLGSKYYVEHPTPFPLEGIRAAVNVDTVGRLGEGKIQVLGAGTATEWPHVVRGVGFVTGIEGKPIPGAVESSDQESFVAVGIPGIQIFTKAHADYHRPSDTADKVPGAGLVKVSIFVKEIVGYLTEREDSLTATIEGKKSTEEKPAAKSGGRRVRFGTIPDFAFQGPGARVEGVSPDSPAAVAGLEEGDVIMAIEGQEVADLRGFSAVLKTLEPGQTVEVTLLRGEETLTVAVTVTER